MLPTPQLLNQVANFIKERGKLSYYCLFLLGKEAGLRISEAVKFDLSLKKEANLYLIQGKKHKKRAVFIDPQVIKTLKQNHWKPNKTNRFSFAHFLQKTKKELGIPANIELTPHTLRRCFATYQANSGMPLPVLQKVLGHSSIRTTALYWKGTNDPKEKVISDKWLNGKIPKEPPKPIENKPQELPKFPENNWKIFFTYQRNFLETRKIFLNIHQETNIFISETSKNLELEKENKLLQEKVKQLEQEKQEQKQVITNLKSDKENLTKQLIQVQNEKQTLLKLLSTDLKKQQILTQLDNNKQDNNQELHQQLIAQIQVLVKN